MICNFFHNINSRCLTIVLILCVFTCSYSQQQPKNQFSVAEVETFEIEVVQHKNMHLFFDTKSKRMQLVTRFLNKQYIVGYSPKYSGEKFNLDSNLELNNEHNKSLSSDVYYSSKTFNPLKYMFPMYFISNKEYRSENISHVITIQKLN